MQMPRPQKSRKIHYPPMFNEFKPMGVGGRMLEKIVMTIDEYEALRLADYLGYSQEEAADEMEISRPTFTRLIESARKKVAEMLVQGKKLVISGGNIEFRANIIKCLSCGRLYRVPFDEKIDNCPSCGSDRLINFAYVGGGHRHGKRWK